MTTIVRLPRVLELDEIIPPIYRAFENFFNALNGSSTDIQSHGSYSIVRNGPSSLLGPVRS